MATGRGISGGIAKRKAKRITVRQRAARRINIRKAREYKKKSAPKAAYALYKGIYRSLKRKGMGKLQANRIAHNWRMTYLRKHL